ncbi:MAG: type II pantothenate kinase [Muribaculaceae bacterium]
MGIVIGIDVGGSTTKIVGLNAGQIISPMFITATDPVSSLFGAFGKYIYNNNISLNQIDQVMITGVGSAYVEGNIYGLPTAKADEFQSDGLGARFGSKLNKLIVVSMGTGTTLVQVEGNNIRHLGGISMGGGTLMGLSSLLLKTTKIETIQALAEQGNVKNVNLQIEDICKKDIEGLPLYATASLFGKASNAHLSEEDIAIGIYYLVIQTIGSAAVLSGLNSGIKDYVMIGNLAQIPQCRTIFSMIEDLYKVRFHIPEYAEFRTAIGAALCYNREASDCQK